MSCTSCVLSPIILNKNNKNTNKNTNGGTNVTGGKKGRPKKYKSNKERETAKLETKREWYMKHKEESAKYNKKYYKNHKKGSKSKKSKSKKNKTSKHK